MRIVMHGPMAGPGPHGQISSWAPNEVVEVDDDDEQAVAWAKGWLQTDYAHADKPAKPEPKPVEKVEPPKPADKVVDGAPTTQRKPAPRSG